MKPAEARKALLPPNELVLARWRHLLAREGGFIDHPADPGRATNYGITIATLSQLRGTECTANDVRAVTMAQAAMIIENHYYRRYKFDLLPTGLAECCTEMAVLCGPGVATRSLQGALRRLSEGDANAPVVDGVIGPVTVQYGRTMWDGAPGALLDELESIWRSHLCRLVKMNPSLHVFAKGWASRCTEVVSEARSHIDDGQPARITH